MRNQHTVICQECRRDPLSLRNVSNNVPNYISLSDNGVVIDKKIKEKIFEPFYITGNQGKGPILPIAYRIINIGRKPTLLVNISLTLHLTILSSL